MTSSIDADFQKEALVHMDALYRYARRLSDHEKDAEDLLQETFLRAYRFWHKYERGTNCKAWLYRIMRNLSINKAQKRAREAAESIEDNEEWYLYNRLRDPGLSDARSPERLFFEGNWSPQIRKALDQVPAEFRDPLLLCDVEGLSYQEISDLLDVPIGTVRSRLSRARGKLQRLLWDYVAETQPELIRDSGKQPD